MLLGVPTLPLFTGAGACIVPALYLDLRFLLALPLLILVMRSMARRDDMIFRLLALNLRMRLQARNVHARGRLLSFSPTTTRMPGVPAAPARGRRRPC